MNKYFVFFAVVAAASAAVLPNEPVPIVSQESDVSPDGSFVNRFQTGNGISYQEQGQVKSLGRDSAPASVVTGTASWTAPDGTPVEIGWTADETGAHFTGSHLPTPPPTPEIPAAIQRALEWIKEHPYVEPEQH